MKALRQRKAFTIVEMVIVIAVIAVLATVMIPTISGVIDKANVSVDQQLAASLNTQLAVWEADSQKTINSEEELIEVLGEFYDGDFYENLKPKSGDQGYSYWFDAETRRIILARSEDLRDPNFKLLESDSDLLPEILLLSAGMDDAGRAADDPYKFEPNSPRSLLIDTAKGPKNLFLLDKGGSELGEKIDALGKVTDRSDYEALIQEIKTAADGGDLLLQAMLNKLHKTVVITEVGIFRFDAKDVKYAYVPEGVETIKNKDVYACDPTAETVTFVRDDTRTIVDKSVNNWYNITIKFPNGIETVEMGALSGFYNENDDSATMTSTPTIYVKTTEDKLDDIFEAASTDCVIVLPTGDRYAIENNVIKNLSTGNSAGDLTVGSIESIGIQYNDSNSTQGADGGYFYNNNGTKTLYLAYDLGSAQLMLDDNLSASLVNWTVSDNAPITVDSNGKITIIGDPNAQNATATVTASLKAEPSKSDTIAVQLVFPTTVTVDYDGLGTPVNNQIAYAYDATQTVFNISKTSVGYTQSGYAIMANEPEFKIELGEGNLFTQVGNTLTLVPTVIATQPTQELTVSYGDYWVKNYTITVTDNSSSPFSVNKIVNNECNDPNCEKRENCVHNDVVMGATYLFRVGNGNSFTLDKLFSCEKAPATFTLGIYDASKVVGEGEWQKIATNGTGFNATYTENLTKDSWKTSTITFGGTGVAIIKITTPKGTAQLAVEVVDGKNVTSADNFKDATNYVLLNDIDWGSSKNVGISGTIYGNGFAINATTYLPSVSGNTAMFNLNGGTIDNLVINGPVYPELSFSGAPYYVAGIRTTDDVKITNSYISGFRTPVWAAGTSIHLENTTLVGGNYANLWVEKDLKVYIKDVTTVQEKENATVADTSKEILGAGIIVNSGISNLTDVTVEGYLNQYNWVTESEKSYLDSDIRVAVGALFTNSTITHNGRINTGILFMGSRTNTVNDSRTNKASIPYQLVTISSASIYTHVTTNGAVSSFPTYDGYTPSAQMPLKPVFKDNIATEGRVEFSIDTINGETCMVDASVYTVSKYTNQNIAVNISCSGGTRDGNTFTFSADGIYTITYTVEDKSFYNADGSKYSASVIESYTVTVNVSNSNHPNATLDVNDISKTLYMILRGNTNDTDYAAAFAILDGLKITDYNRDGSPVTVTVPADALPAGLTVSGSGFKGSTDMKVVNGKLYMYDTDNPNEQNGYGSITIKYTYRGKNGNEVSAEVTHTNVGTNSYTTLEDERSSIGDVIEDVLCVAPDTMVMLGDGSQKKVQDLTYEDELLVWNFFTGEYDVAPAMIIVEHEEKLNRILSLNFSDGTTVRMIDNHGFFNADLNKWVFIEAANVEDYIGDRFVQVNGETTATVVLESYSISEEYCHSYWVQTAFHNNFMADSMFSLTTPDFDGWFDYFEIGDGMKYDEEKMQADIEKYGLYTYEEFEEYGTYEQFMAFNGPYWKVLVGRGVVTLDQILWLISEYLPQ